MIAVYLSDRDRAHTDAVRDYCEHEARTNPALAGTTCPDGTIALIGWGKTDFLIGI
jgi:hypothetical protein